MTDFILDSRLESDTIELGALDLCRVRLMNDSRYPWLILVPQRVDVSEIVDLDESDALQLMREMQIATRVMLDVAKPDKVNVAALGNVVPQLHVHVIGRFLSDPAWPGPVWAQGEAKPYPSHGAQALIDRFTQAFLAA